MGEARERPVTWAKVIDHESCIGCHACTTACKSENEVPLAVTRTYVKVADVGTFPQARRAFQVTRCNQCERPPCVAICPTQAMVRRADGIVDFDKSVCIGCKACMAACPYDAIFINPEDHSAEKCNFCAHRLDVGLEPACVVVCPTEAIVVGDRDQPDSRVAALIHREPVTVRRPEKGTLPKLFYRGAHQATLDPLAARRPGGGLFAWSEQKRGGADDLVSGHPPAAVEAGVAVNSAAAALLAYDVPHRIPWDWKVSLYTLTKGIAAGAYLVAALLAALGMVGAAGALWSWAAPLTALAFLGVTGLLLIADLEHPARFWMIFARPHWRSWLVRGAFLIALYGAALTAHLLSGGPTIRARLAAAAVPLAVMAAVYTAYLFAQAQARDLWQNPLLPLHLLVQATLAGAAALLPVAWAWEPEALPPLLGLVAIAGAVHLMLLAGEAALEAPTAHARLAEWEMTRGRYGRWFGAGALLTIIAVAAAWLAPELGARSAALVATPAALAGLGCFEHAWVQAGQAVPLA